VKGIDQTEIDKKFFERYRECFTGGEYEEMDFRKKMRQRDDHS
jgi:hypothetical protein